MAIPLRLTAADTRRTWHIAILLAGLTLLVHAALIATVRNNAPLLGVAGNTMLLLESLAAAAVTTAAWLRVQKSGARPGGWVMLSVALWINAAGQAIYLALQAGRGGVTYPSPADPFFFAGCLVFAAGLTSVPGTRRSAQERLILGLEMGTALMAGTLLFSVLGIAPIVANSGDTRGALLAYLAYPAADVALFWAIGVAVYRRASLAANRPLNILLTAAILKLAADTSYSYGLSSGAYVSGDFPDLLFAAVMVHVGLAAVLKLTQTPAHSAGTAHQAVERRAVEHEAEDAPGYVRMVTWRSWLPFLSLLTAFALLVWHYYHPMIVGFPVLAAVVAGIIILLGLRQILALREAEGLYKSQQELVERRKTEQILRQTRDELELRVAERTRELQAANAALEHEVCEHREAEARLQTSLNEKEVLLKEVHHRVKNNLQVVSSLLALQSRKATDAAASELLLESQGRVKTMALIHQKLYASPDLGRVNFRDYLQALLKNLSDSYRVYPSRIALDVDVTEAWLGIDTAVPCGLIVNELVSNSLKHAFPGGRKGHICVGLARLDDGSLCLSVEDDGVGLPPGLDYRKTESLGLQLAVTLTRQLGGLMDVDCTHGAAFRITFTPS